MDGLSRRGGIWWVRLVVPARLRERAQRREFIRSTRTHDLAIGKLVASALLADWRRQLFELERGPVDDQKILRLVEGSPALHGSGFLTLNEAADLIGLSLSDLIGEAAAGALDLGCRVTDQHRHGYIVNTDQLDRDVPDGLVIPPREYAPPSAVDADMLGHVLRLPDGGRYEAQAVTVRGALVVDLVALETRWGDKSMMFVPDVVPSLSFSDLVVRASSVEAVRRRWAGGVSEQVLRRISAPAGGTTAVTGEWAGKLLSDGLKAYVDSREGLAASLLSPIERGQRLNGMLHLVEVVGDKPLGTVTADDLRVFRDWLPRLPGRMNTLPQRLRRASVIETVAAVDADQQDWPRLSDEMQQERMGWICRFFGWLKTSGRLSVDIAEPVRGKTGKTRAEVKAAAREKLAKQAAGAVGDDEDSGRAFTDAELKLIFSQMQFQAGDGRHMKGNARCDPFEYWLPLLCLWHGLRRTEAAQLWLSDLRQVDGVWLLDINELTPDKSLKNLQSARRVPIRSDLIKLGLLEYRARLMNAGFTRLFPDLRWTDSARYSKEVTRKFGNALLKLGMPRDGMAVIHSFRHNFVGATQRIDSQFLPPMNATLRTYNERRLTGHLPEGNTVSQNYTEPKLSELVAIVEAVRYEGLPEVAPFDVEWGVQAVRAALGRKHGASRGVEDLGPAGAV